MKLEKIARDIGYFGIISAVIIFLVLSIRLIIEESDSGWKEGAGDYFQDFLDFFLLAIAILVVAIPEGLPLAVTLSLAFSVNKMAQDNNLVRKMQACETMGGANIICSDKTGTLTRNEMYWTHFWNTKEYKIFDSEASKCMPFKEFTTESSEPFLLNTVILNSKEDPASAIGNPTEMALLKFFHLQGMNVVDYRKNQKIVHEGPFNSDRKRMSTIIELDDGKQYVFMKGASEHMLKVCNKFHSLADNQVISMDADYKKKIEEGINSFAIQALRTIGLCYKEVQGQYDFEDTDAHGIWKHETGDFTMIGIAGIKDIIRDSVPKSVR